MHNRKICVVGLGYVGLPAAVAFSKLTHVIGFDANAERIAQLKNHTDRNRDMQPEELNAADIFFTHEAKDLNLADFYIVAVPTPLDNIKHPDFAMLISASEIVGKQLKPGDIVVYESTVYPGATEEVCVPVLEKMSQLKCGEDFTVGYSPERINPGEIINILLLIQ